MKLSAKVTESLARMAEESGQTVTTVAKALLVAAIKQAEDGEAKPMPPYLRRFYGDPDQEEQKADE
tara:strand:+ start:192 stop:389 length:198 start_codon:yes stop_codon:yes gene_type:complete